VILLHGLLRLSFPIIQLTAFNYLNWRR